MRTDRDWIDVVDIALRSVAGVLIPTAIFLAGLLVADSQRESEEARRNQQQIADLLSHLASDTPRERLLAIELMRYMAADPDVAYPSELIFSLVSVAEQDENAEVARAASATLQVAVASAPDVAAAVAQRSEAMLPRVYVHIRESEQQGLAERIAAALEDDGFTVPSIQTVAVGPSSTQVRFFSASRRAEAERIRAVVETLDVSVALRDMAGELGDRLGSVRQYELWVAPTNGGAN